MNVTCCEYYWYRRRRIIRKQNEGDDVMIVFNPFHFSFGNSILSLSSFISGRTKLVIFLFLQQNIHIGSYKLLIFLTHIFNSSSYVNILTYLHYLVHYTWTHTHTHISICSYYNCQSFLFVIDIGIKVSHLCSYGAGEQILGIMMLHLTSEQYYS